MYLLSPNNILISWLSSQIRSLPKNELLLYVLIYDNILKSITFYIYSECFSFVTAVGKWDNFIL